MFGAFETSLRGGDSPSIDRKNKLHKGCSGHLHGHGVKKEKSVRDVVSASRSCSLTYSVDEPIYGVNFGNSSSEEDRNWGTPRNSISPMIPHLKISPTNSSTFNPHSRGSITPDLLLGSAYRSPHSSNAARRSQSTDITNTQEGFNMTRTNDNNFVKRSTSCTGGNEGSETTPYSYNPIVVGTNKAIADRLYNSLTRASAGKRRAERSASDGKRIARAMASQQPRPNSSMDKSSSSYKSKSLPRSDFNEDSGNFSSGNSDLDEKYNIGCIDGTTVQELVQASVTPTQEERRQSLINGISDDDIAHTEELRRRKRRERQHLQQQHLSGKYISAGNDLSSNNIGTHRRQSPSPRPKVRINRGNNMERGRRGSEEDESGSSSGSDISPPSSPSPTQLNTRSASLRPWSNTNRTTTTVNLTARRTKSSGIGANSNSNTQRNPVGFGSRTSRFNDVKNATDSAGNFLSIKDTDNYGMRNRVNSTTSSGIKNYLTSNKASQALAKTNSSEGYQSTSGYPKSFGFPLTRTSSNESSNSSPVHFKNTIRNTLVNGRFKSNTINRSNGNVNQPSMAHGKCSMQEVAEAWLRFKDDVDNAMELKKPNSGFYKNLSDMMHSKMKMLDQVQFVSMISINTVCRSVFTKRPA